MFSTATENKALFFYKHYLVFKNIPTLTDKVKAIPWWALHRPNQKQERNQTRQYSLDQVLKHQGMKICQILLETQTIQVDSKYAK